MAQALNSTTSANGREHTFEEKVSMVDHYSDDAITAELLKTPLHAFTGNVTSLLVELRPELAKDFVTTFGPVEKSFKKGFTEGV